MTYTLTLFFRNKFLKKLIDSIYVGRKIYRCRLGVLFNFSVTFSVHYNKFEKETQREFFYFGQELFGKKTENESDGEILRKGIWIFVLVILESAQHERRSDFFPFYFIKCSFLLSLLFHWNKYFFIFSSIVLTSKTSSTSYWEYLWNLGEKCFLDTFDEKST